MYIETSQLHLAHGRYDVSELGKLLLVAGSHTVGKWFAALNAHVFGIIQSALVGSWEEILRWWGSFSWHVIFNSILCLAFAFSLCQILLYCTKRGPRKCLNVPFVFKHRCGYISALKWRLGWTFSLSAFEMPWMHLYIQTSDQCCLVHKIQDLHQYFSCTFYFM